MQWWLYCGYPHTLTVVRQELLPRRNASGGLVKHATFALVYDCLYVVEGARSERADAVDEGHGVFVRPHRRVAGVRVVDLPGLAWIPVGHVGGQEELAFVLASELAAKGASRKGAEAGAKEGGVTDGEQASAELGDEGDRGGHAVGRATAA